MLCFSEPLVFLFLYIGTAVAYDMQPTVTVLLKYKAVPWYFHAMIQGKTSPICENFFLIFPTISNVSVYDVIYLFVINIYAVYDCVTFLLKGRDQ
jgi:hypothetical protein